MTELLVCDLRSWHGPARVVDRYYVWTVEWIVLHGARVLAPVAEWEDVSLDSIAFALSLIVAGSLDEVDRSDDTDTKDGPGEEPNLPLPTLALYGPQVASTTPDIDATTCTPPQTTPRAAVDAQAGLVYGPLTG